MYNNSSLYYRMININNSLFEMTKESYKNFIYFTNSRVFIKYLDNCQMIKLKKLREMLLDIHPIYSRNCILYSGASLLLYGSTYTNDIDIIFYNMKLNEIYDIFGKIIKELSIDFCYFEDDIYKSVKTNIFNSHKICIHHNNNILKDIGTDDFIKENIINFGGIYMFNHHLTKMFYINRFKLSRIGTKHYILLDFYSLYTNNNFGFFKLNNDFYNKDDLSRFIIYMNKYNNINLNNIDAINLIKTFCDAIYLI